MIGLGGTESALLPMVVLHQIGHTIFCNTSSFLFEIGVLKNVLTEHVVQQVVIRSLPSPSPPFVGTGYVQR